MFNGALIKKVHILDSIFLTKKLSQIQSSNCTFKKIRNQN